MEEKCTNPEDTSQSSDEITKNRIAALDRIDPHDVSIEHIRWWRARGLTTTSRVLSREELDALDRHVDEIFEKF